jgi:hypothetical protein
MVLIIILISFRKIPNGIPLASTCSIAISAACHCPKDDTDASLLPVQWGVITPDSQIPARCSLTTLRTVRPPRTGEEIGGITEVCKMEWQEDLESKVKKYWRKLWKLRPRRRQKDE